MAIIPNCDIEQLVAQQFQILSLKQFYGENLPKIDGYFYQGVATKVMV